MTAADTAKARVVLVTSSRFWVQGSGLGARTRELVLYLSKGCALTVVYLGAVHQNDIATLNGMGARFGLVFLADGPRPIGAVLLKERFRRLFNESSPPAIYIVVKTELSFMLDAIPKNNVTIVDTNDLVSARTRSMAAHHVRDEFPLTRDEEIALLRRYDRVICIQPAEHAAVADWLGPDKAILAPHPVRAEAIAPRPAAAVIGFVASRWHANVDGLAWFIEQVWPALIATGLRLDVYGYVCEAFPRLRMPNIRLLGFVDDLDAIYATMDIAINPVRYGAGLKIKTVEAMAHGLPMVVSYQGATGLEELAGRAFLASDDAASFASNIKLLAGDFDLRQSLSRAAHSYAETRLGPDQCFRELGRQIDSLAGRWTADHSMANKPCIHAMEPE